MVSLKHYLWIAPFICFFGTYAVLYYFFSPILLITPHLLGKNIQEVVQIASDCNINLRIICQKEDPDIAEGTVITQLPTSNRTIRPHQSLFITVSKKPAQKKTPTFLQKSLASCDEVAQQNNISLKKFFVTSTMPRTSCIGQIPVPEQPLDSNHVIVYISQDCSAKPILLPSFKKKKIDDVIAFLTEHSVKYAITHARTVDASHDCKQCIVIDQKPLAGSFIDVTKPITIQLYVQ